MNEQHYANASEYNRSRVITHLYFHGVSSRAQIAKALSLTPAAITKITAKLLEEGMIQETGHMEETINRRSIGLMLDSNQFHVIGVKFARSLVQISVFDLNGQEITNEDLPPVNNTTVPDAIRAIHERIRALLKQDSRIIAIGMAVPGPYLKDYGQTAVVSSMQAWRSVNFIDEFSTAFDVPVFIEQDARAGALAQQLFAPTQANNNLAYYLLGEGIGLGVIEHGRIINGTLGTATEVGHVSIDVQGKACDCGNYGCLERYASAVAIHETLNAMPHLVEHSSELTHRQACSALFEQAQQGNSEACALVEQIGTYIGYGAVTIINAFNPERIVLGDIVAQAGERLLQVVQRVVDERVIPQLAQQTTITLSQLPTDATVTGAAAVAITQFLEHPSQFLLFQQSA